MMPDHTAKYNALIKDKAEEIRKLCFQYDIPCFMSGQSKARTASLRSSAHPSCRRLWDITKQQTGGF